MNSRHFFRRGFPKHWRIISNNFNTCWKLLQKTDCWYATLVTNTISANFHVCKKNNVSYEQNNFLLVILKARLNILSPALSWTLWCCVCCTYVIFNRVEPPLNILGKCKKLIERKTENWVKIGFILFQMIRLSRSYFKSCCCNLGARRRWSPKESVVKTSLVYIHIRYVNC